MALQGTRGLAFHLPLTLYFPFLRSEGEISAQGTVELSCEEVDGDVHAEARAKVAGAEVKTSSSGKVTVTNVRPTATLDVVVCMLFVPVSVRV